MNRIIVINYEVENQKLSKINAHYSDSNVSINIDEINDNYMGINHTYDNMCRLCECYSLATQTPIEYVVLDSDEETKKELEDELLKLLID